MATYTTLFHYTTNAATEAEFDYWFQIGRRDRKLGAKFCAKDHDGRVLVGRSKTGYLAGWKDCEWN